MYGTDNTTGQYLAGTDHLRQSVADILTTPLNSRTMIRGYGSRLFALVDMPMNDAIKIQVYAAVHEALNRWEPRLTVDRVTVNPTPEGRLEIQLVGRYMPDGQPITMEGLVV